MVELHTVLVTGANSGLGYSLCCRLIDEFLATRPSTQTLQLIFTTRDAAKSNSTLARLQAHLAHRIKEVYGSAPATAPIRTLTSSRVRLVGETMDLTRLATVKACAGRLAALAPIHVVVLNAGIGGWLGLNWPRAVWEIVTSPFEGTTLPTFKLGSLGWTCKPQTSRVEEPPLGEVFAANVFGHYLLVHWLRDALHRGRVVWTSSIEGQADAFDIADLQGIRTTKSYESSKRLTELLALTSERAPAAVGFLPRSTRARQYLVHPGVCLTSISGLHALLNTIVMCTFIIVRWLGSPWHTCEPYTGAVSAAWVALAADETLNKLEADEGKAKWGSATDRRGEERVVRTEVDGWGWGGREGETSDRFWRLSKRWWVKNRGERHDVQGFEELGREVWEEMERLRIQWEEILKDV